MKRCTKVMVTFTSMAAPCSHLEESKSKTWILKPYWELRGPALKPESGNCEPLTHTIDDKAF
jgi:hypothetical protein